MLGNLGNKDRRGRQARIGHHGRNLRVSRTGGVSLRQSLRAGRFGMAVNSQHGLRLSSALGRGTQVATQNGRFVLRGRYGRGPIKFNLSKSGVSASLSSEVGRLNLTHPARSSAKLLGVQVRGRKAATMNLVALLATAVIALIQTVAVVLLTAVHTGVWLVSFLVDGLRGLIGCWQGARADRAFRSRHEALQGHAMALDATLVPDDPSRLRLLGHVLLTQGLPDIPALAARLEALSPQFRSKRQALAMQSLAEPITLGSETTDNMDEDRQQAWCLLAARLLFEQIPDECVLEHFLALDDLCLAIGDKTEAQEDLLALIAETSRLRLTATAAAGGIGLAVPGTPTRSPAQLVEPFLRAAALWP